MTAASFLSELTRRRHRVLAFVDLVQDIDVMLPVLLAIRDQPDLELRTCVSRWLSQESPRTAEVLAAHGLPFAYVRRRDVIEGRAPSLRGLKAVVTASESTHLAHVAGHALARRADAAGLGAYTLQHGLENAGLFGAEAALARFASTTVFCWFPPEAIPDDLPQATRAKLVHVGRPEPPAEPSPAPARAHDLGVFENLHWERYADADRAAFRAGVAAVARALPGTRILVRAHPAGGWADQLGQELAAFGNITLQTALDARLQPESGAAVLRGLSRVITTPSTIALDAAAAGAPVALAAPGGGAYDPLPVLHGPEDWVSFAAGGPYDPRTLDQFRSRVLVAGNGAPRIAGRLSRDFARQSPQL